MAEGDVDDAWNLVFEAEKLLFGSRQHGNLAISSIRLEFHEDKMSHTSLEYSLALARFGFMSFRLLYLYCVGGVRGRLR